MSLHKGSNEIGKVYKGSDQIGKIYKGDVLIYSAEYRLIPDNAVASDWTRNDKGRVTVNSDGSVTLACSSGNDNTRFYLNVPVDLSQYTKFTITISSISSAESDFRMLLLNPDDHSEVYWEQGTKDNMNLQTTGGSMTWTIASACKDPSATAIFYFTCNYGAYMTIEEIVFE